MPFGQTFDTHDLALLALLVVLEGVLSIDNALVLGLLARRLPRSLQGRALTYGLIGAFVFRFIAIATATFLLKWTVFKLLGGAYLLWVAGKHFFLESKEREPQVIHAETDGFPGLVAPVSGAPLSTDAVELEIRERAPVDPPPLKPTGAAAAVAAFWPTVIVIEMTDIAFAVDSIVAAIGVVGSPPPGLPLDARHPKLWVVLIGGFLGVVLMRFAAVVFIKLLEKFPRFETAAYLLVVVIGMKLVVDFCAGRWFGQGANPVDFHSPRSIAFWLFWALMLASFLVGFLPARGKRTPAGA